MNETEASQPHLKSERASVTIRGESLDLASG
jgi:hypothetical protein